MKEINHISKNNCKKVFFVIIIDLIIFTVISLLTMYKALKGGLIITNLLFNNALLYYFFALAFFFASVICVVKLSRIKRKKIILRLLFPIVCLLFGVCVAIIIIDNVSSSFYIGAVDSEETSKVVVADDVFTNLNLKNEYGTIQVRSWYPYINTTVSEVQQSFDYDANAFFYSVKVKSYKFFLVCFEEEILNYLSTKHSSSYNQTAQNAFVGEFRANNYKYRFLLQRAGDTLCFIVFRGEILYNKNLIYPLSQ